MRDDVEGFWETVGAKKSPSDGHQKEGCQNLPSVQQFWKSVETERFVDFMAGLFCYLPKNLKKPVQ